MNAINTRPQATLRTSATARRFATPLLLTGFSLYYFIDILLRSSQKYFWFDELTTLYVCRLDFRTLWIALRHGIDFNPPLFYLLTKASKAVFGETLIGMRVPEIAGFWIFCLCLFWFVNRRAGPIAGLIAMVLPTITGAFYYAYEARPTALVLGFSGLAIVCWQMARERPNDRRWLIGFSFCLFGACMMHCYALLIAIPFGIVGVADSVRFRRINSSFWLALLTPVFVSCISYVPLLLSYRGATKGTDWSQSYRTNVGQLEEFYVFLLSPCILFVMLSFAALAASRVLGSRFRNQGSSIGTDALKSEVILGASFVALPLIGFIVEKALGGVFFDRYFVFALAGVCIVLGLAVGSHWWRDWVAITLAVLLVFPVGWQFSALVWHRYHGTAEKLIEPSSHFSMNDSIEGPLGHYSALLPHPPDSRPIGVLGPLDFIYLLHYAPNLRPRLYYIKNGEDDFFYRGYENFHRWAPFRFNHGLKPLDFVRLAPQAVVLGERYMLAELARVVSAGGRVRSIRVADEDDYFLAEVETK